MNRFFLDTGFFVHLFAEPHRDARSLYDSMDPKFSNEYVIKELRRVFQMRGYSELDVSRFIHEIRSRCRVMSTPSKDRFGRFALRDRSDVPIVLSARDLNAVLVTYDHALASDAKKYVETICLE